MIQAQKTDEPRIIELLSTSFDQNPGVNDVVRQFPNREKNVRRLISYAVKQCYKYGQIWLSNDKCGCVLVMFPRLRKRTPADLWAECKLAVTAVGLNNVKRVMERQRMIMEKQVKGQVAHIWFIGVHPSAQNKGAGTRLLKEVTAHLHKPALMIIVETNSNTLPWYGNRGFVKYNELQLTYLLHFMVYVPTHFKR